MLRPVKLVRPFPRLIPFSGSGVDSLFTSAGDISNAAWTKVGVTATAAIYPNPWDGTVDADRISESGGAGGHNFSQGVSMTSGQTYKVKYLVRPLSRFIYLITLSGAFTGNISARFNLKSGFVETQAGAVVDVRIRPLRDGFFELTLSATATSSTTGTSTFSLCDETGVTSYTGNSSPAIAVANTEIWNVADEALPTNEGQYYTYGGINAENRIDLYPRNGFRTNPTVVATGFSNVAVGGIARCVSEPTKALTSIETVSSSLAADIGSLMALSAGFDDSSSDAVGLVPYMGGEAIHSLKSPWPNSRLLVGQIDGTGAASVLIGKNDFTITDLGTGNYQVFFRKPFASPPVVIPTVKDNVNARSSARATAVTTTSCTIVTASSAGAAADRVFNFWVFGNDKKDIAFNTNNYSEVYSSQRKPRMIVAGLDITAGAPAHSQGTGDFTLADTGTGVITITPTKPFAREPIVISSANIFSQVGLASASSIVLNTYNAAGAPTDASFVHALILGFDDGVEY